MFYFEHPVHALELLTPLEQHSDYLEKLGNFANIADELLFHGSIPAWAVVSVVELKDIVHYVPGYNCKWLGASSYRDSNRGMCHDHISRWGWDAGRYGLECAHLAWALLRLKYVFDLASSSVSPPVNNMLVKLKGKGYPMDLANPLVEKISSVLAVVKDTGSPIALMWSHDHPLRIDLADGDLPITMLKLSLVLSREGKIRDELHAAYIETSTLEPSKPGLSSDLEDCLQLIHVTAADLLGQIGVTTSPDIKLRIESAQQKLEEFTDNFVTLAASFPFSHIGSMGDRDWKILKLRIEEAVGLKLKWLQEVLKLLCRPDTTKRALRLEETTYEDACRWFQP
ncbi:hypothetical protein FRC09_009182 [Ceratobasidium sp. 395]|nr:hypothetical protein FRC09_009182 [Ceratobasidium sp. 395]